MYNLVKTWSICVLVREVFSRYYPSVDFTKDCGAKNEIKSREPIRCRECGHRIMYKKRTKRSTFRRSLQCRSALRFPFDQWCSLKLGDKALEACSTYLPSKMYHTIHTLSDGPFSPHLTNFVYDFIQYIEYLPTFSCRGKIVMLGELYEGGVSERDST